MLSVHESFHNGTTLYCRQLFQVLKMQSQFKMLNRKSQAATIYAGLFAMQR